MLFGNGIQSRLARILLIPVRTATKRASGGKAANNRTAGRRLGPKKGEGEFVEAGQILWRQRGTKWYPGENAGIGRDHTIFAKEPGYVRFYRDPFHAKRRFIGIALGHNLRLPTPHFEPRRRRLGYQVIDNEEVAQFEADYLTRKETKRVIALNDITSERSAKKALRIEEYQKVLAEAGVKNAEQRAIERLDAIFQYMRAGMDYNTARDTVDSIEREDISIACRTREEPQDVKESLISKYANECEAIDSAVAFGPNAELAAVGAVSEEAKNKVTMAIAELAKPYLESPEGTPKNVVDEVNSLLSECAALSSAEAAHLRMHYLRRPLPIVLTKESKEALEKRAKKGEGKIQDVWDYESSGVKRYFIPTGAKLIFA